MNLIKPDRSKSDTETRGYHGISIMIPRGVKIYTRNEDKYQTKNDTICNNYTPRMSHRATRSMRIYAYRSLGNTCISFCLDTKLDEWIL